MTHYIPMGSPELRGVAQANCGQRVPVTLHDSEPTCPRCSSIEADLEHGMAGEPSLSAVEDYPEPEEVHPEPDHFERNEDMEPVAEVATRVLGFRPAVPSTPPYGLPKAELLTSSLEQASETLAIVRQSTGLIDQAEALAVTDGDSWLRGIDIFDILRAMEKAISEHYDPHVQRAHAVWNGLTTERRRHLEPVEKARKALGDRCAIWKAEQDRLEKAEKQRLEREAREEQQLAAARAAVQAERAGEPETAKAILEEAKTAPLPMVAHQSTVPTSSKATTPLRWTCNVIDLPVLLKAIGEGQFPEFHAPILEALQPILNKQATVLKGELGKRYPGTEGRQKPSTAGRG